MKTGKYEVVISELTLREIRRCPQPKQADLVNYLGEIEHEVLYDSDEAKALAKAYVENGVLTQKRENDCLHIAFASTSECDVIVSWNFKHMLRLKTIQGVRITNAKNGYFKPMDIIQPTMIGDDTR